MEGRLTMVRVSTHEKDAIGETHVNAVSRNSALDFTKGSLVLLMVLYHWFNYFVSPTGEFYKYLRFITPSFIFICGFLISNVYLQKYSVLDFQLHRRLVSRGLKLLVLFSCLNFLVAIIRPGSHEGISDRVHDLVARWDVVYCSGSGKAAAFAVLAPISYTLICAPVFLLISRLHRYSLATVWCMLFGVVCILKRLGNANSYAELFTIGILGIVVGRAPVQKVDSIGQSTLPLLVLYGLYLLGLNVWGETYPLQICGVCLGLLLIYNLGLRARNSNGFAGAVSLLGQYSLIGYIAQIGVALVLSRVIVASRELVLWRVTALALMVVLTFSIAKLTAFGRNRFAGVDNLYKMVFA